jgi:hypothetical protein
MASTTVQNGNGLFSNPLFVRSLGWSNLWVMFAYLFNNFATFWGGLPGASLNNGAVGLLQLFIISSGYYSGSFLDFEAQRSHFAAR